MAFGLDGLAMVVEAEVDFVAAARLACALGMFVAALVAVLVVALVVEQVVRPHPRRGRGAGAQGGMGRGPGTRVVVPAEGKDPQGFGVASPDNLHPIPLHPTVFQEARVPRHLYRARRALSYLEPKRNH